MTTSAGSLDQGYQGDAECDPRSEGGTGTASSPTEDVRLFEGVIDVERLTGGDASLADDEGEVDPHGSVTARDRTARIIDGKLYHSHRELGRPHDPSSEMDSSGFYSDLDPRERDPEDESGRTDLEPVQEALATHSNMHDSLLDHDHTLDDHSLQEALGEDRAGSVTVDEEEGSWASTLRPESKDATSSEAPEGDHSPQDVKTHSPSPPTTTSFGSSHSVKESAAQEPESTMLLTDSGILVEEGGEDAGKGTQPQPKPRTYDKPWLSRPPPPKKKEEVRRPLPPPPPMPKKNVQSKLKALLEAQEPVREDRLPRQPRKNRWDDVMTKIEEGKREDKVRPKVREVRSRLMDGVLTQAQMSPQAERIRQERRERRERRERQAALAAVASRRASQARMDRKRSSGSTRSNRTSRAPSLDSLPADPSHSFSRASTPDHSEASNKSCSTASGGGGSRGSRDSRVVSLTRQNGSTAEKKRADGLSAPPRRPRLDNIKSTIPKPGRLPPRNNTDPVKAARPGGNSGSRGPLVGHNGPAHQTQPQPHPAPHADQLRRLEAEVAARVAEARAARNEKEEVGRGLEALTVLLHHLTTTYDPFSTPRLKAEVVRLDTQLTEARLNLDESSAAVRRAEDAANSREQQHQQDTQQLQQQHQQVLDLLRQQHKQDIDLALEKHRKELSKFAEDQQTQREEVSRAHSAELEQLEGEWRNKLDVQHEKHLCALQDLNTQHTHKLRELETSRRARERELEEANYRLTQDQEALRQESRKLQETLLNDTDHRLVAVRKMCTSLKSEVDSLKTVVDMKNSEIHELRGRVVETERLGGELEAARERVRALQAKTEDLQAQMEKRVQQERHLVNEHRHLLETFQRESNTNKRLSLENEELAWKLRQREEIMSTSMPSSTLDLVSRAGPPRHQEGAALPQAAPRSPRVAVRSPSGKVSPSKCDPSKRRSHCLGLSPEDNGIERGGREKQQLQQELSFESPPPSPCVKSVVEKSNSVSFILDLNDSTSDDSFLDLPPSPRPRPQRTASLSAADRPRTPTHIRRVMHNNRANSLNRNGIHVEAKPKDFSRKSREVNGKAKEPHEKSNGKSLEINGRPGSRRTTSESSEGGSEVERISPTGLAWTVPVHQPKSPVKIAPLSNGSPVRKRIEHHLLEDPDEDEYEETPSGTHQFIEVVGLTSSSEAASDSELSQCDIKEGSSADSDSDSSDSERQLQKGIGHKSSPWCPQEGAGEAMITDELLKQYAGDQNSVDAPIPTKGNKRNGRRRLPSAPSSDSDENVTPHNEGNNDVSWSEDVDITSSSEIHEL